MGRGLSERTSDSQLFQSSAEERECMPLNNVSAVTWVLLLPAAICVALYTLLGVVGLLFFGGRISNANDFFLVIYPLLAAPVFSVTFWGSLQKGAACLWIYFLSKWLWELVASLPRIAWEPISSRADWFILAPAILVQLVSIFELLRRRQAEHPAS
jgi:hypothetical protein